MAHRDERPSAKRCEELGTSSASIAESGGGENAPSTPQGDSVNQMVDQLPLPSVDEVMQKAYEVQAAREKELIEQEDLNEALEFMLSNPREFADQFAVDLGAEISTLRLFDFDLRAQKLLRTAMEGSDTGKRLLKERMQAFCRDYAERFPAECPKERYQPSVHTPERTLVFPILLAHLDDDGSSLDLFARMHERYEQVNIEVMKREEPAYADRFTPGHLMGGFDSCLSMASYIVLDRVST